MSQTFEERLNQILPKICAPALLNNQGLGNEIGFWIFDYPTEREMDMRAFLKNVIEPNLAKHQPPIKFASVNLFDLVLAMLEERGLMDKAFEMQQNKGDAELLASLRSVLKEDRLAERLVDQVNASELDLVILSGVGAAYPMVRVHTLLSALHPHMKDTPLLVLYPGHYDGTSLKLFNKLTDDHYYRAFRLVP